MEEEKIKEIIKHIQGEETDLELNHLEDGIYDMTDISHLKLPDPLRDEGITKIKEFVKNYPNFVIANAYETMVTILIAKKPQKLYDYNFNKIKKDSKIKWDGSGFNYGSTNILDNCPKKILILAEND